MKNLRLNSNATLTARIKTSLFVSLVALALAGPLVAQGKPPSGCIGFNVTTTFRDLPGDAVSSDGGGPYTNSLICESFSLSTDPTDHFGALRGLLFQLNNPTDNTFPPLVTDSPVPANLGVEIALDGGIGSMAVGTSAPTTKVQFNFVYGKSRFFLRWGSNYPGTSTATVTRTAADTWIIETSGAPGNIAMLHECPAKGACRFPIDRFYFAPLHMTLVSQP